MPRLVPLLLAALISLPAAVSAQQRDSVFASYEAYAAFVDRHIMQRDFIPLIQVLGGRDEYTPEQLRGVNTQLLHAFPRDFTDVAVFRETDLGNGFRQEARGYWNGERYAWFYAFLHQREAELVVLRFVLNSSSDAVMERF